MQTWGGRLVREGAGGVASKLHTGRSRNDQVATASRMWTIDACAKLDVVIRELQATLLTQAVSLQDALLPAYTHMQRAIPVSGAHWLLSHFWPLERDRARPRSSHPPARVLPPRPGRARGAG